MSICCSSLSVKIIYIRQLPHFKPLKRCQFLAYSYTVDSFHLFLFCFVCFRFTVLIFASALVLLIPVPSFKPVVPHTVYSPGLKGDRLHNSLHIGIVHSYIFTGATSCHDSLTPTPWQPEVECQVAMSVRTTPDKSALWVRGGIKVWQM